MAGRTGTGKHGKTYFYYACTTKACGIRIVAGEIEGAILDRLAVLAKAPSIVDGLVAATNTALQRQLPVLGKRRRTLMREHAEVKGQADRLLAQLSDVTDGGARGMVSAKLNELAERKRQLEDAIFEVERDISRVQAGRIGPETVLMGLSQITEIYQHLKPHERKELVRLILQKAEVHPREIRLALYSEALSTMAEGPVPAISSSKRSRSPIRLPVLVSQSVVRFESPIRLRSLNKHLQWKQRHAAATLLHRCPMPPGTPCPKYGSTPTSCR